MLALDGVAVNYGQVQALKGISLEVLQGEIVTILGANGAGKTTTLKAISGLLVPARGAIYFQGRRIDKLHPHQILRLGIAHCPEGRRVFPQMSLIENLEMGAYIRGDTRAIKEDMGTIFRHFPVLEERRHQRAGTLSGGEQQMLAIARCLMSRPKLIMFDEPSLGLAPLLVETVAGIIRQIKERGTTALLVEQNAFVGLNMADRAYVLETGQVTIQGRARDLLQDEHVKKAYLGG